MGRMIRNILFLLLILLPEICLGWGANSPSWAVLKGSGAQSCPGDEVLIVNLSGSQSSWYSAGGTATTVYTGLGDYNPGATKTICSVGFAIRNVYGTAKDWQVEIYQKSGTSLGDAPSGDCISEVKSVSATGVIKFGDMACVIDNANYGVMLVPTDKTPSATDYLDMWYPATTATSGNWQEFSADKTIGSNRDWIDISIDIWGF